MIDLIQTATLSDNNERQNAEKTLINLRQQNPLEFIQQTCMVFIKEEINENVRQAAGTIIAASVKKILSNGKSIWEHLELSDRDKFKNMFLGRLMDTSRSVRRSAANIVANICSIELPKNLWTGIIERICENVKNQNPVVKQSSILTLGFICENMKEFDSFSFSASHQQNILTAILLGIKEQEPILLQTSLKALKNSLGAYRDLLGSQQARKYIFKQICRIISEGKYLLDGLYILSEYIKIAYETLGPFLQNIYNIIHPLLSKNQSVEDDCCIAAMEIIGNIAEYYYQHDNNPNIINYITGQFGQALVVPLLNNLTSIEENDPIEGNPIFEMASTTLESIFVNGAYEYKNLVLAFITSSMATNNWKFQQASVKAFSLLITGLTENENSQLIQNSFNQLIQLLNHNSLHVQYVTLDSLLIISQTCSTLVIKSQYFKSYLELIVSKILVSPTFMHLGCKIIENLCAAQKQIGLGIFNGDLADKLIQFFLKICLNQTSSLSIVDWSTEVILSIIEVTRNNQIIFKYFNFTLENFQQISTLSNDEKKEQLYDVFFTIIQYCLHVLDGTNCIYIGKDALMKVYRTVVGYFQKMNRVTSDGLYVVQALIAFFKDDFGLVEDFWKYIIHALNNFHDSVLLKASISCLSFFVSTYTQSFAYKIAEFFPVFLTIISVPEFDRDMKTDIILFLGQILLHCGSHSSYYIEQYFQMIMFCCNSVVSLQPIDPQYADKLKYAIVEGLKCAVVGSISNPKSFEKMGKYTKGVLEFVQKTCEQEYNPTVNYVEQCILLLTDYHKFFPSLTGGTNAQFIVKLNLNILNNFKNPRNEKTINYARTVFKL